MHTADDKPNLYLVGFMGTGKSTFGRILAQRLGMLFADSDAEIEAREGRTVAEIFARDGEPRFRELERRFILEGHPPTGTVVACGGGLVVSPGMLEEVRARGVVICLHASEEAILHRTTQNRARPLLHGDDPAGRIRRLMAERLPIYQRAGTMVLTDNRSIPEVVEHLIRVYRRDAREFAVHRPTGGAHG